MVSSIMPSGSVTNMVVGALSALIPVKKDVYFVDAAKTSVMLEWTGSEAIPKDEPGLMDQLENAVNSLFSDPKPADTGVTLTHFADDRPGVVIEPVTKVRTETSYNGKLVSYDEVEKVRVTISVIPHSKDEQALNQLALDQDANTAGKIELTDDDWKLEMKIFQSKTTDNGSDWLLGIDKTCKVLSTTFKCGRLIEIQGGYGQSGEFAAAHSMTNDCRLSSNSWVFEFTKWENASDKAQTNWFNVIKNVGTGVGRVVASVI